MSTPAPPKTTITPPAESELKGLQQAIFDFITAHGYVNANASGFLNATNGSVMITVGASYGPEASYTITTTWPAPAKA
jgi:hypothetical protein